MRKRIALFGGSFNPPHVGHLLGAQFVRATQRVDEVWLMPTYRHPFRKPQVEFEHRVAMCEALARDSAAWLKVSRVESEVPSEGHTVDTLTYLIDAHSQRRFVLVLGSDIIKDLPLWKDFARIQTLVEVLVLNRAGYEARESVGPALALVSSTEIRTALEHGKPPTALVPSTVLDYIEANALYRA